MRYRGEDFANPIRPRDCCDLSGLSCNIRDKYIIPLVICQKNKRLFAIDAPFRFDPQSKTFVCNRRRIAVNLLPVVLAVDLVKTRRGHRGRRNAPATALAANPDIA